MERKTIEITFSDGSIACWSIENGDCDNYDISDDDKCFIVQKDGKTVGYYNMLYVASIVFKS